MSRSAKTLKMADADMTDAIRCALRMRYADKLRYALLEEVGNATGFNNAGWADGVLMHLWPSDGLKLWGFEIKASRSDWLKELAHPEKSEKIARFCDRWIVVAPLGLVRDGELPPAWALWEYDIESDSIRERVKGELREATKYIHRGFLASLIRRTVGTLPSAAYVARISGAAHREVKQKYERKVQAMDRLAKDRQTTIDTMARAMHGCGFYWSSYQKKMIPVEAET